jgi:hypothetical protein
MNQKMPIDSQGPPTPGVEQATAEDEEPDKEQIPEIQSEHIHVTEDTVSVMGVELEREREPGPRTPGGANSKTLFLMITH